MMGGLAAALLPAVCRSGVVWFGASGRVRKMAPGASPLVQIEPHGRGSIATVDLPEQHYAGFYERYANSVLWPLLHSRVDLSKGSEKDFASYQAVNAFMARTLATFGGMDSCFWVHDYHYLTVARELRRLGVNREIGLFLHTPWASREIMMRLPECRELVEAMLDCDLIGFQTTEARDNFSDLVRHLLHLSGPEYTFRTRRGTCRLGVFPISIDAQEFADSAQKAGEDPEVRRLRASLNGEKLIVGVDRIDYSKGILQRLTAYDRLLTRNPDLKRRVRMLQVAVPSRGTIDTYRELRQAVAGAVADINGRHAEIDWSPIRYLNKSFCQWTLAGIYRAAAVGLVTPLQDGMNLVAKEYVAAQDPANPGVLVLSRFAGAARELDAALLVDPNDIEGLSRAVATALTMPGSERRARWQHMMDGLLRRSIHVWFAEFMDELKRGRHTFVRHPGARFTARPALPAPPAPARSSNAAIGDQH
ncbi:MAG: trehalose-6-phosphate synthase [Pseudolabrys sp.]